MLIIHQHVHRSTFWTHSATSLTKLCCCVLCSYMAAGGDGYTLMATSRAINLYGEPLDAVFTRYIRMYSPVSRSLGF